MSAILKTWSLLFLVKDGVDLSLAGNGGLGCYEFRRHMWAETILLVPVMLTLLTWSWGVAQVDNNMMVTRPLTNTRLTLAMLHTSVMGVQVLFKIISKQLIYLLSPCHVVTMLQIYILFISDNVKFLKLFRYIHIAIL